MTPSSFAARRRANLAVQQLEGRDVPASGLGAANDFSALVLHDANLEFSSIHGRLAVGGNAHLNGLAIGDQLPNSHGTRNDLIVGGNLNFVNGQIFNGNAAFGGTGSFASFGEPNGTNLHSSPLNFAAAETQLDAISDAYALMGCNGVQKHAYGTITLTGSNPDVNVFKLSAGQLWYANGLIIKAPAGSTVIVNVFGQNVRMQSMGIMLQGGATADHVAFNFPEATQLRLNGVGVEGSVLAPRAALDFSNGEIHGTLVVGSWTGNGAVWNAPPQLSPGASRVGGLIYSDQNGDGVAQDTENRLQGVSVTLTGIDQFGDPVHLQTMTNAGGIYHFTRLLAGTYSIQVSTPAGYNAGQGTLGGFGGTPGFNTVTDITVPDWKASGGYNFGELPPLP
jgi:choice-of-anchor A domain-containing protein